MRIVVRFLTDALTAAYRGSDRAGKLAAGAAALLLVVSVAVGFVAGPGFTVLLLAAGALLAAVGTFWTSLRALFGETKLSPEEAFSIGAPSAEEEQKRAVLRAIKDLEFERTVGKISEEDYRTLVARYRAEAKQLLRVLDEKAGPRRVEAERLLERHLAGRGLAPANADRADGEMEPPPAPESSEIAGCPDCGTDNDTDAVFCKKCGTRLQEESA